MIQEIANLNTGNKDFSQDLDGSGGFSTSTCCRILIFKNKNILMIISPCKSGRIDPVWNDLFKNVNTDIPIVIVTKHDDYVFNDELLKLDKWILVCGVEYGWDYPFENFGVGTHIWGESNLETFGFKGQEWENFNQFVFENKPALVFKRELIKNGYMPSNYYPINYPCWYEIPEIQSKEEFDLRPIKANFIWGLSHEYRKTLHAEIWQRSGEFGYVVCDNISNIVPFIQKEDNPNKWVTVNTPWYARHDMNIITSVNTLSKISISIAGAGRHCFRHSESPMASVMFLWDDGIKYSYPWVNNVNCIMSKKGDELNTIIKALDNHNLYEIYKAGVENCRKYHIDTYSKEYIGKIINGI